MTTLTEEDRAAIRNYAGSLDEDWCTVRYSSYKHIGNLILVCEKVFIADVDCDENFTKEEALDNILAVEEELGDNFRVYETYKGFRVFDVAQLHDLKFSYQRDIALARMTKLKSDEKYIYFCEVRKKYAARMSPKQNRPDENKITSIVKIGSEITNPRIYTVVKLHDEICLDNDLWCPTWRLLNTNTPEYIQSTREDNFDSVF